MSFNDARILSEEAVLTPVSDKEGHEVLICSPQWFDARKTYKISNAPERTAALEFSGADLNFAARILYAEASGSMQLTDKAERDREKEAILNVKHFRLNRRGYPNNAYIAQSFRRVCEAPGQFESFFKANKKFSGSEETAVVNLEKRECGDLNEALAAVRKFIAEGPNPKYTFDNFRGYNPNGQGLHIGRSRFWLSDTGKKMFDKQP